MARRIVVVGASAGGVEALITFAGGLPQDLDVPVAVVLHVAPTATSVLPAILSRAGPLDARHAHDGVAPPNQHLLVDDSTLRLARGPHENGHRPAIDPLFRSAASDFGPGTIAVVLSGTHDDGAAGVAAIAERGGDVLVQHPDDAVYSSMPEHAIAADHPEYVVPVAELPALVARLASEPVSEEPAGDTEEIEVEESFAKLGEEATGTGTPPGKPVPFGCPACGGVYVAPPDAHLVVAPGGSLMLETGPPVNHLRPSIDRLLASLAESYGGRAVAVVLSGTGKDGSDGVRLIKGAGGTVFAQSGETSEHSGMPDAAIATGMVDRVLPLNEIAAAIVDAVTVTEPA